MITTIAFGICIVRECQCSSPERNIVTIHFFAFSEQCSLSTWLTAKEREKGWLFFFALSTRIFSWNYSIYSIHFKIDFAHSTHEVDFPTLSHWASLQWQWFQRTVSVTFVDWLMTRPFSDALIDAFKYLQYGSIPPFPYLYNYTRMLRSRDTRQHFFFLT